MEFKIKKIFTAILTSLLVVTAISLDVSAAKKSAKLSNEVMTEMSENVDKLTQKIYGKALFSPQDNETLIGIKIKLDNQMLVGSTPELAPLYYKTGIIYKLRDMKPEAIECFQTILENFNDTALAPKAKSNLEEMGVLIQTNNLKPEEEPDSELEKDAE